MRPPNWLTVVRDRTPLWLQFGFLVLVVVTAGLVLNYLRYSESGRQILLDHETIDLGDDATLRVYEFREAFEALTAKVGRAARALNGEEPPTAEASQDVLKRFRLDFPQSSPDEEAGDPDEVRLRYFPGTLVGTAVVDRSGNPVAQDGLDAAGPLKPLVADAVNRAGRVGDPTAVSRVELAAGPGGPRAVVAVTRPARYERLGPQGGAVVPTHFLLVVIDLTRYLANRGEVSPRHFYILTAADGTVLFHPDRSRVGSPVSPTIAGASESAWGTPQETPTERARRHAALLEDGGARVPPGAIQALRCVYQKGYFLSPEGTPVGAVGPDAARAMAAELDPLRGGAGRVRVGQVRPGSQYLEVAVDGEGDATDAALARAREAVQAAWGRAGGGGVRWVAPVACRTFQGQLTELVLARDDDSDPARLIVVASVEELVQDISSQFNRIGLESLLFAGVAAALTLVGVLALTRRLARLARTAVRLRDPMAPVVIAGGGSREVTQLANSLTLLVRTLRDSAARFETILRTAGEGIVVADPAGRVEEANRAAATMFGYDHPDALKGVPVNGLLADGEADPDLTGTPGAPPTALRGRRRDGTEFWLEATLRAVELPDRTVLTGIFRDVTARKSAEDEIQRLYADLERRVRVRTAELAETNTKLEAALRQAEAAGRAKDAFVANMSHELRQPLHIIIGFTEAIREEALDDNQSQWLPDLDKVLAAAKHLLDLINDILDLAKIAAGRMELSLTRFGIARAVGAVQSLVEPLAEKHHNRFFADVPADIGEMVADERRVRQMLLNLLSNAFKFTKSGVVTLTVRRVSRNGRELVEFAVSDTGCGMSPGQLRQLFQRFFQADDATTRAQGGTGLGLAITQSFNEVLGGEPIEVTSTEGRGSRFVLRLPAEVTPEPPPAARQPVAELPAPEPLRPLDTRHQSLILVIDDDPGVQELMRRFLGREGFHVVCANSGADGLRAAREYRPAAITLDVMMPGLDGWQVLSALKADPETADIPVVMLTIVDDRGRGFALGAADYLTKPVDWSRLAAILGRFQPLADAPVLVVDDDDESRKVIRRFLERAGWRVTEAPDGEAGLRAFAAETPALVLLDLMMPVLDGFGFLSELPKRFPSARVPVVVLTAKDLTAGDYDRLNGRVARILEKEATHQLDNLAEQVKLVAALARGELFPDPPG